MNLKRELIDFLIWIDVNDKSSLVENGRLNELVNDYMINVKQEPSELLEALIKIVHMDDELCKCPACKIGKPAIKKATS